mmetsp:Transcript_13015/g.40884  ORF Transcript_13015/g.40884 Transcript_13015/m.40884 type:complete len:228 (-) Transcript_13015:465-1148(-)
MAGELGRVELEERLDEPLAEEPQVPRLVVPLPLHLRLLLRGHGVLPPRQVLGEPEVVRPPVLFRALGIHLQTLPAAAAGRACAHLPVERNLVRDVLVHLREVRHALVEHLLPKDLCGVKLHDSPLEDGVGDVLGLNDLWTHRPEPVPDVSLRVGPELLRRHPVLREVRPRLALLRPLLQPVGEAVGLAGQDRDRRGLVHPQPRGHAVQDLLLLPLGVQFTVDLHAGL